MNIKLNDKELSGTENKLLRKYLKDVVAWHGYIRFLGMPDLQENPDVSIDELYVGQSVSEVHLSTDHEPKNQELINPIKFIIDHKQIIVLGDPGSGKSTLVNWLSWYLSKGFSQALPDPIGQLIPIPLVLRDLDLSDVESFDDLLESFIKRPLAVAFKENKALLESLIINGKALLLFDGLDEISNFHKKNIIEIISSYKEKYPDNFLISTSRIVGFDKPQDQKEKLLASNLESAPIEEENCESENKSRFPLAVCYVAPFTNKQVKIFSGNWFEGNYRGNKVQGSIKTSSFIKAIQQNESIQSLSRTPQLLTMMALIFKIKADLPNGRALLYEMIAQAYLQSIDKARELSEDKFTWQEKKLWLARIAFEMQSLREQSVKNRSKQKSEKINHLFDKETNSLVDKESILNWICEEMQKSKGEVFKENAIEYLTWVARRSGLLLPRGEDKYAFIHLSFQEYFASIYIQSQLENPDWLDPDQDEISTLDCRFVCEDKANKELFANWAENIIWNESLTFLLETMDLKRGWTKRLWGYCFPEKTIQAIHQSIINYKNTVKNKQFNHTKPNTFMLQISLFENTHITTEGLFFNNKFIELAKYICVQDSFDSVMSRDNCLNRLISIKKFFEFELEKTEEFNGLKKINISNLDNERAKKIIDNLSPLKLNSLCLINTNLADMEILTKFQNLTSLYISDCDIFNIEAIEPLINLNRLYLINLEISHISFLKSMRKLEVLNIRDAHIRNISDLENNKKLQLICLEGNEINDLSPLLTHSNLKAVFLDVKQKKVWKELVEMHPDSTISKVNVY